MTKCSPGQWVQSTYTQTHKHKCHGNPTATATIPFKVSYPQQVKDSRWRGGTGPSDKKQGVEITNGAPSIQWAGRVRVRRAPWKRCMPGRRDGCTTQAGGRGESDTQRGDRKRRGAREQGGGGGGGWHKASVSDCLPLAAPIGLSPLLIPTLYGPDSVLVVSTEPSDDLSCLTTPGVGCPGDGLLPVPLTRCIQMHSPSPCGVCRLQHRLVRAGVCICWIIFLTGASNNHNDSFPFFLSFSSFCALHRFRRARSALSCLPPFVRPFPPAPGGGGGLAQGLGGWLC